MQKKNATVHLLILDPSQNDAETLVSLMRNSGHATRAHRVTSEEDLEESLKTSSWDLLLARDIEQDVTPDAALATVRRMDKDIPVVLLTDAFDRDRTTGFMKAGGKATVPGDFQDLLMLVIKRELGNLEERRRRRALEAHLREAEQRCQLLLESSKDAIAYINDGMHIYANQSYLEFFGYDDVDELMCIPVLDTLDSKSQESFKEFMKSFTSESEDSKTLNCVARRSDNQEMSVTIQASTATYDGEPCTQLIIQPEHSDAELEEKLKQISSQDLLTGLYNRQHLMEALSKVIIKAGETNTNGSLVYIALDNFQQIKRDIGIAGADLLLGDVANKLREHTAPEATIARLSDDAFCILAYPIEESEMVKSSQALLKAIDDHLFDISGRSVHITVSIGITSITENSPKAVDVMGRAHTASDEVRKQEGHENGNGLLVYSPAKFEKLDEDNSAEAIQRALDEDRFRLLFQPVINLRGEGEEHYEAFVRMLDKDNEEVSPYDFLPPSGPSDMAAKIDRWVVLQTIKQLASHRSKGHDTRLFLNVTAETIQDKTFTPWLSVALKSARLPGDSLIFQIREGDATTYMKQAREFAKTLRELRCKISVSQFGCALNPMNTLKHVEVDYVKIDGSFTEEIQKSDEAKEQVKEMVQTLQSMGKLTIIPLVESAALLATLWQAGVNYIQGYYLQAPVPEMNFDFSEQ